jgi:hypothetical protein
MTAKEEVRNVREEEKKKKRCEFTQPAKGPNALCTLRKSMMLSAKRLTPYQTT